MKILCRNTNKYESYVVCGVCLCTIMSYVIIVVYRTKGSSGH